MNMFDMPLTCVPLSEPYPVEPGQGICKKKIRGESNMYVQQDMTVREKTGEDVTREHFVNRIEGIYNTHYGTLQEKYGLSHKKPQSARELVAWIKEGAFTYLHEDEEDPEISDEQWEPARYIRWTKVKKNTKGFEAAHKKLNEDRTSHKDLIMAAEKAEMPKIVKEFQNITLN